MLLLLLAPPPRADRGLSGSKPDVQSRYTKAVYNSRPTGRNYVRTGSFSVYHTSLKYTYKQCKRTFLPIWKFAVWAFITFILYNIFYFLSSFLLLSRWSEWWGLNSRPDAPKAPALSTELHPVINYAGKRDNVLSVVPRKIDIL